MYDPDDVHNRGNDFRTARLELANVWCDYRQHPASWMNSVMVHVLVLTALILPFVGQPIHDAARPGAVIPDRGRLYIPIDLLAHLTGGAGGGGDGTPIPASRGPIPRFSLTPLAPPSATLPEVKPLMPVQPNLLGPPQLTLPEMSMAGRWGDPHGVTGPYSNGPGHDGGIGDNGGGGVGSRGGPSFGPDAGECCGGVYPVGNGVSAPVPLYKPEPPYSEEARKAKYQGTVELWIVVDTHGNVADVRVARPLGMGLDEKAVEAVRTWRFKPAYRNGVAVPVRVMVEVMFRLF